jgi:hypothetical protein
MQPLQINHSIMFVFGRNVHIGCKACVCTRTMAAMPKASSAGRCVSCKLACLTRRTKTQSRLRSRGSQAQRGCVEECVAVHFSFHPPPPHHVTQSTKIALSAFAHSHRARARAPNRYLLHGHLPPQHLHNGAGDCRAPIPSFSQCPLLEVKHLSAGCDTSWREQREHRSPIYLGTSGSRVGRVDARRCSLLVNVYVLAMYRTAWPRRTIHAFSVHSCARPRDSLCDRLGPKSTLHPEDKKKEKQIAKPSELLSHVEGCPHPRVRTRAHVWFYPRDALSSLATLVGVGRVEKTALSCSGVCVCVLHGFFCKQTGQCRWSNTH